MNAQPAVNSPAIDRGIYLLTKVPAGDLPHEALVYASYLCTKYGMCGEVMLTGYVVYAQIVEGLVCDDDLYMATSAIREEWEQVQRNYERVFDEATGRTRIRKKMLG
jgi:hypothetical protein